MPSVDRFRRGVVVVENEARDKPLDRASGGGEAPSSQILRYLGRAEAMSGGAVKWGVLSSGRFWRLYWADARARAEGFVEIDLPALFGDLPPGVPAGAPPDHWLRVFLLLFRRDAFVAHGTPPRTFLDDALAEGRRYEARVTDTLSEAVFDDVFPALVAAIGRHDPSARIADETWRAEAREGALRLLFRLLFVLYAAAATAIPSLSRAAPTCGRHATMRPTSRARARSPRSRRPTRIGPRRVSCRRRGGWRRSAVFFIGRWRSPVCGTHGKPARRPVASMP